MAPYIFAKAIHAGAPIELYHLGSCRRDFTYIDDIVAGTLAVLDTAGRAPGHRLYNLAAARSEDILDVIELFEKAFGKEARIELQARRAGRHAGNLGRYHRHDAGFRLAAESRGGRGRAEVRRVVQEPTIVCDDRCSTSRTCAAPSTASTCCAASISRSRPGGITGLIGPNGAGKTTLFNVRLGPGAARRRLDPLRRRGTSPGWRPSASAARGLVRTFQIARGFPRLSVFENLMLYGRDQPGETLWQAVVGTAAPRASARRSWPSGRGRRRASCRLDHVIDNPATALSGGQKKLLEIGRALMAEPKLVLLDEPTAGVNPTLPNEIGEQLLALPRRGITVLLIEHDMGLIAQLVRSGDRHGRGPGADRGHVRRGARRSRGAGGLSSGGRAA